VEQQVFNEDEIYEEWDVTTVTVSDMHLIQFSGLKLSEKDEAFLQGPLLFFESEDDERPAWDHRRRRLSANVWMLDQVSDERFQIITKQTSWIIGPSEIALLLMGAMAEDPNPPELFELYLWSLVKLKIRRYGHEEAKLWKLLKRKAVTDADVLRKGGRLHATYESLATYMRDRITGGVAEREAEKQRWARENEERTARFEEQQRQREQQSERKRKKSADEMMADLIPPDEAQ